MLGNHNEENDSACKEINGCTEVRATSVDLRGHIALSTKLCLTRSRSIATSERSGEAEVGNLEVKLLIKKYVFGLQVSMSDSALMNVIKSIDKLLEVEAGDLIRELSSCGNIVEEFSTWREFKSNANDGNLTSIFLLLDGVFAVFNKIHDVRMVQVDHGLHFSHHKLKEFLVKVWVSLLEDLNGMESACILVLPELNLGIGSTPERS